MKTKRSTITIPTELKLQLAKIGFFGESYTDVITKLLKRWNSTNECKSKSKSKKN